MSDITVESIPPPPPSNPFQFAPMHEAPSVWSVISALLKQPGRVLYELLQGRASAVLAAMALVAAVALAVYGVVAGSFEGGQQMWIAPAKILLGSAAAAVICLPSLFVFLCMNGADAKMRHVAGVLLASVCLMAVLLVSLAPITWVFSQSTTSVAFMGTLHLILWAVAIGFGLRLLARCSALAWGAVSGRLGLWACIYVVVCLQMMTAVRPIVGKSDTFLPTEKKFFLAHWVEVLGKSGGSYRD